MNPNNLQPDKNIRRLGIPICHVVVNISDNAVQFRSIADDTVVEPGLPYKWDVFFVGKFRHSGFEIAGNQLHLLVHRCGFPPVDGDGW